MATSARSAQLQRYRDKRDFQRTSEPSGAMRPSGKQLEFVIQRHDARRLHYDFRLEWNGVLKSWAVPKGPSLNPSDKRLAVEVEDHPFEYRTFSGEIPAGEYGAGTVLIWDRGSWQPQGDVKQGLAQGKLDFTLEGERLHGRWSLVRLSRPEGGRQNWLLIKGRDEHAARPANGLDVTELYATGLDAAGPAKPKPKVSKRKATSSATPKKRVADATPAAPVERSEKKWLTHPERVLYPIDGVTKRQLADYFEAIAPVLWPHLQKRPLSVIRATGAQGRAFFQRHLDGDLPGLTAAAIPGSDEEPYFMASSLASIPRLAQMGAVELHTWGSRMPRAERADRITFDLDPDPTLPWKPVRDAAMLVRGLLQELGLQCRIKTTGGQGLHLVVPLQRGPPFEVAAAFSRRVAEHLARLIPERFSAKRGAPNRKGRIYVDWQRNQLAATTVAAYSPRQRPGVPVSMPIDWDELGRDDIRAAHFNLRNVAARIAAQGDAWQKVSLPPQALTQRVIERLERADQ